MHFSEDTLLWECNTVGTTGQLPWEQRDIRTHGPSLLCNDYQEFSAGDRRSLELCRDWFQIVKDYTTRPLAYETDKLPALAGLALRSQKLGVGGRLTLGLTLGD